MKPTKRSKRRINSEPRAVAIFDVLGIKEGILGGRSADIAQRYSDIIDAIPRLRPNPLIAESVPRIVTAERAAALQPSLYVFSDTIILVAKNGSFDAAALLLVQAWRMMQSFFAADLPLRGAVAFGELHTDDERQTYVGPALVTAHELEQSQAWAGAVIHSSFMRRYPVGTWNRPGFEGLFDMIFPIYDVPFKSVSGEPLRREERVINWAVQVVRDVGFSRPITDYHGKTTVLELHPYLQAAFAFAKRRRGHLGPVDAIPLEFRVLWIGKTKPPFPAGDEIW